MFGNWNSIENNIFPLAAKYKRIICCRPTLLFAASPILYYSIMNQKIHELSSKKILTTLTNMKNIMKKKMLSLEHY